MKYWIYILKSKRDNGLYVGLTSNVIKRVLYHNSGRVRSTKSRTPFELLHKESYATRTEAREREKYLKSYRGSKEKMLIVESL